MKSLSLTTRHIGLALLMLLLATVLRIHNLNAQGLWGDEAFSVRFSDPVNPIDITERLVDDLHPPLYFIMLGSWREVAGSSEVAMRLLAVYTAILSVALIIRIGRKLFSPQAGVLAGMIVAIADKHIVLSQEVRHYPMAFMLMAASSLVYLLWLDNPTRRRSILYGALLIISVYTHYYTTLILMAQVVYALLVLRPWTRIRDLFVIMGIANLTFLPWLPVAYHQIEIRPEGILHSYNRSWATLDFFTLDFLGRPIPLFLALLVLGVVVLQHEAGKWRIQLHQSPTVWYAVLWFILPIALALAIFDYVTLLTDRNMALVLLPLALLIGHGITAFRPPAQLILAIMILANGLTSLDSYFDHPPWREMGQYVTENYPEGEPIVMDVQGGHTALGFYLRTYLPEDTELISLHEWRYSQADEFDGLLDDFLQRHTGFWVAYWGDETYALEQVYNAAGYTRTASHTEYHLGFPIVWYHYDKVPPVPERIGNYDGKISLHQMKAPGTGEIGNTLTVSLWWSTSEPLPISYSISVFLLDENGVLRAQHDGAPQDGDQPTNTWQPDMIVFDAHRIPIPENLPAGEYRLAVKVYNSADNTILSAKGETNVNTKYLIVGTVRVK